MRIQPTRCRVQVRAAVPSLRLRNNFYTLMQKGLVGMEEIGYNSMWRSISILSTSAAGAG